jgi:hypothetical protein
LFDFAADLFADVGNWNIDLGELHPRGAEERACCHEKKHLIDRSDTSIELSLSP